MLALAIGVLGVVVDDSHCAKGVFLMVFVNLPNLHVLVRLARNQVSAQIRLGLSSTLKSSRKSDAL